MRRVRMSADFPLFPIYLALDFWRRLPLLSTFAARGGGLPMIPNELRFCFCLSSSENTLSSFAA